MNFWRLVVSNIKGSSFRSVAVILCAMLVASFTLAITLILRGAQQSLTLATDRLGADIIVVPEGAEAKVESALLMGVPTQLWMPRNILTQVAAVSGVEAVSPQLYLSTLKGASCCSAEEMFLVAYDPTSDFTIKPWLEKNIGHGLALGEVVGGSQVFVPEGEQNIKIYGYFVTLKANMPATGTGMDQTMFLTFETAKDVASKSWSLAEKPLDIPVDKISAVVVKTTPGSDPHDVAVRIIQQVPNVTPIESPNLFQSYRKQITGILNTVLVILVIFWILSIVLIGLIFSMAANERRRELGVLRAMGAPRFSIFGLVLSEACLLAMSGGAAGALLTALFVYLFRGMIIHVLGVPYLFPALPLLLLQIAIGLVLALISVSLATLLPAFRVSRMDPATAMRE